MPLAARRVKKLAHSSLARRISRAASTTQGQRWGHLLIAHDSSSFCDCHRVQPVSQWMSADANSGGAHYAYIMLVQAPFVFGSSSATSGGIGAAGSDARAGSSGSVFGTAQEDKSVINDIPPSVGPPACGLQILFLSHCLALH